MVNKITKVSKNSQQNNLETVTNENEKERYMSPEKTTSYWLFKIKIIT